MLQQFEVLSGIYYAYNLVSFPLKINMNPELNGMTAVSSGALDLL